MNKIKIFLLLIIGLSLVGVLLYGFAFRFDRVRVIHLETLGNGVEPLFSEDATQILFANSDGLQRVQLTDDKKYELVGKPENLNGFSWLDSNKVIFRKVTTEPLDGFETGFQFWILDISAQTEFPYLETKFPSGIGTNYFDVSPSREKIAFSAPLNNNDTDHSKTLIHILDTKTGNISVVDTPGEVFCIEPDWSADETKLIYTCVDIDKGVREPDPYFVWITDYVTKHSKRLSNPTDFRFFSWSPDNKWVAFTHNASVWLAPIENGYPNLKAKYHLRIRDENNWDSFFGGEDFYLPPLGKASWSLDSKYIVLDGGLNGRNEHEVWLIELEHR